MIDARVDAGVPCITTLPDTETATFVEEVLGIRLQEWQVPLLSNRRYGL